MICKNNFTLKHYKEIFQSAIDHDYQIITCNDFFTNNYSKDRKILVNRVDIDVDCKKAKKISDILNELNIKATFFVRLHAKEYNPYDFENYLCLKSIKNSGHEIGLHSEIVDCNRIWNESTTACLLTDIKILSLMFDIKINGVASHGGITIFNNLDFWTYNDATKYKLIYEAYDFNLFNYSFYVSDGQIKSWKCYKNGILQPGDDRCICEHIKNDHKIIYLLTHPMSYYERHIYES